MNKIQCQFCDIIEKKKKAVILFEDNDTIAFLDKTPFNLGHSLVIPKKHYKFITDMPNEDVGKIFKNVNRLAKAIVSSVKADGLNIGQSNGKIASQTIFHVHIHIIPRFKNDAKRNKFPVRKKFNYDELKESGTHIRKFLKTSTL